MKNKLILLFTAIAIFISTCFISSAEVVSDNTVFKNSTVTEDLSSDPDFDTSDYPIDAENHNLQVIQVAESSSNHLYVYVYSPAASDYARHISMYYGMSHSGKDFTPSLYELSCVSQEGPLYKYLVLDFVVPEDEERYYNIAFISRDRIDSDNKDESIVGETSFEVAQQWCCYNFMGLQQTEMCTFETVELNILANSVIRLPDGITLPHILGVNNAVDVQFIVVSCDQYLIDHVYEAYLSYRTVMIQSSKLFGYSETVSTKLDYFTLTDNQSIKKNGKGLFGASYEWNRIMKVNDFISTLEEQDVEIKSNVSDALNRGEFVFSFWESPYTDTHDAYMYWETRDVSVLRLDFQDVNGNRYNLPVVSDLTFSDGLVSGVGSGVDDDDANSFLEWLFFIIFVIIILLLWPLLKKVFRPVIDFIFDGIAWIINSIFPSKKKRRRKK